MKFGKTIHVQIKEVPNIPGMTLRHHFAGVALTAIIGKYPKISNGGKGLNMGANVITDDKLDTFMDECVTAAYRWADKMVDRDNPNNA